MTKLQKKVLGAAVALAFSGSSAVYGAASIQFDPDGAGGSGPLTVQAFDWIPGNALAIGALSAPEVNGVRTFDVVAQARLGTFVDPNDNPISIPGSAGEFTFQVRFTEQGTGIGTGTSTFAAGAQPVTSTFSIYRQAVPNSDGLTGTGFGDGQLILHGTIVSLTGNFTNQTVQNGVPPVLLDGVGADNQNGTLTHVGNGSSTIQVNVDFQDSSFFLTNVSSLLIDLQDTTNNAAPFSQVNPSDAIFGITPFYSLAGGVRTNGAPCTAAGSQSETGTPGTRCDIHVQSDATTSFNPVPEPGMLALFGLGLGILGVSARRRGQARG